MKRLFLVLGLLGASLGLAAPPTSQTHNWEINFPKFAYVWINIGDLTFDLSDHTPTNVGYLVGLNDVHEPSLNGLLECLNNNTTFTSPSGAYTGTQTAPSAPVCRFAPEIGSGTTSYTVVYEDPDDSYVNYADADLFIVSSGDGWTLEAQETSAQSIPSGVTLEAYPYVWDTNEGNLEDKGGNNPSLGTGSGSGGVAITESSPVTLSSGAGDKGYYVSGKYWMYLQPVNFALAIDFSNSGFSLPISLTGTSALSVEYTVTAP